MSKVSVIIPVYNSESYLHRCVKSIIDQSFQEWEILLIDDGSSDQSGAICEQFASIDQRIRVFHKENGGASSARNYGIKNARGEWIMFVDADDWIARDCLDVCLNEVYYNDLDAIQFSLYTAYSDSRFVKIKKSDTQVLSPELYMENDVFNVCVGGGLYKKKVVDDNGLEFPLGQKLAEDQIFVLNYFMHSKRLKYIDNPMYFYYQNQSSAVHNQKSKDMVAASYALIDIAKTWKPAKRFVDTMCMVFITNLIRLRDVPYYEINKIYTLLSPQVLSGTVSVSTSMFFKLSRYSTRLAFFILSLYFRLNK